MKFDIIPLLSFFIKRIKEYTFKKNGVAQDRVNGVSANALVMPIIVAISILHILIIVVILMINSASSNLSAITRKEKEKARILLPELLKGVDRYAISSYAQTDR